MFVSSSIRNGQTALTSTEVASYDGEPGETYHREINVGVLTTIWAAGRWSLNRWLLEVLGLPLLNTCSSKRCHWSQKRPQLLAIDPLVDSGRSRTKVMHAKHRKRLVLLPATEAPTLNFHNTHVIHTWDDQPSPGAPYVPSSLHQRAWMHTNDHC